MQTSVYKLELYLNVFMFNAPLLMNTGHWKPFMLVSTLEVTG